MSEKQKGMGRSGGGEDDAAAAALRPRLGGRNGVGCRAGPRGGTLGPGAAGTPQTGVHRRPTPPHAPP